MSSDSIFVAIERNISFVFSYANGLYCNILMIFVTSIKIM